MRGQSVHHSSCLAACLLDETGGEKGSAAAERAVTTRIRGDHAITGARQDALRRARVFRLEIAGEGVGEKNNRSSVDGPHPPADAGPSLPRGHGGGWGWWRGGAIGPARPIRQRA